MSMFCYQCEQTAKGTGCTIQGVCGKDPTTAALQDLLYACDQGHLDVRPPGPAARRADREIDRFVVEALFATVTNVDFDPERLREFILKAAEMRDRAKKLYEGADRQPRDARRTGGVGPRGHDRGTRRAGSRDRHRGAHAARATTSPVCRNWSSTASRARRPMPTTRGSSARRTTASMRPFHEALDFLTQAEPDASTSSLGMGAEGRRGEPQGDGAARRGQHRRLRPSRADAGPRHAGQGQGASSSPATT